MAFGGGGEKGSGVGEGWEDGTGGGVGVRCSSELGRVMSDMSAADVAGGRADGSASGSLS